MAIYFPFFASCKALELVWIRRNWARDGEADDEACQACEGVSVEEVGRNVSKVTFLLAR